MTVAAPHPYQLAASLGKNEPGGCFFDPAAVVTDTAEERFDCSKIRSGRLTQDSDA